MQQTILVTHSPADAIAIRQLIQAMQSSGTTIALKDSERKGKAFHQTITFSEELSEAQVHQLLKGSEGDISKQSHLHNLPLSSLRQLVMARLNGGFPTIHDTGTGMVAAFQLGKGRYHFAGTSERDILLGILQGIPSPQHNLRHLTTQP